MSEILEKMEFTPKQLRALLSEVYLDGVTAGVMHMAKMGRVQRCNIYAQFKVEKLVSSALASIVDG